LHLATAQGVAAGIKGKYMLKPIVACSVLFCLVVPSVKLLSQTQSGASVSAATPAAAPALPDPKTPEEFFARARSLSDLEASGIPFHLKATYVASGDTEFTGNGTYEEWWQSKDLWRKEATLGDYKYVAIKNGDTTSAYSTGPYVPLRLRQAMDNLLIRIPSDGGTSRRWKLKHKKLNGVDFAVLATEEECGDQFAKVKCVTQDYFTSEGVLRIQEENGAESVYNNFHAFRGLAIPVNIMASGDGAVILSISIQTLELLKPGDIELLKAASPPASLHLAPHTIDMAHNPAPQPAASKIIHLVQPHYPADAKHRGLEGKVVVDVIIDEAGNVREPFVIKSAGPLLDRASLDAVRQWKYSPTVLNGVPVSVHTMISVVFSLNNSTYSY
jgi:TonB family protein